VTPDHNLVRGKEQAKPLLLIGVVELGVDQLVILQEERLFWTDFDAKQLG
jgi:hypothetical protein